MIEEWKDIKGYEGKYQISSFGNVRSLYDVNQYKNTKRIKILKLGQRNGYSVINLCKNGKRKSFQIHRLVAEAFIPNEKNDEIVNHIDEDKKNNNVNNLEWCTQLKNVKHSLHQRINKSVNRVGSTGEKYICKRTRGNKSYFELNVYMNGKKHYLGKFYNIQDAIKVREKFLKIIDKNYL